MSDVRESFPILEDGTQAGVPLSKKAEGDAAAGGNYAGMLVGKDPSGNLQFVKLNSNNEVVVDTEGSEQACLTGEGNSTGSASYVDLATITLALLRTYKKVGWSVSCFRDAIFEIVYVDDVGVGDTETVLATIRVGAGDYTDSQELECLGFDTLSGTGTQELRIRGKNLNALSDMDAALAVSEIQ